MDPYDPTNILFTKIKSLEPENASKIIGYLLIQDIGKKGLMRLAFGPETLLHSLILQAKTDLGLPSYTLFTLSTSPSQSTLNPISRPNSNSSGNINPLSQSSPRLAVNGFLGFAKNPSSPSSNSWSLNNSTNNGNPISPKSSPFLSYDNIRAGSLLVPSSPAQKNSGFVAGGGGDNNSGVDFIDEHQVSDYLSFLNDSSSKNEGFIDSRVLYGYSMNNGDTHLHRRSFSASDACLGSEDAGFVMGYKPCLYFARGFCKNGDNCKFVHGGFADNVNLNGVIVGSPSKMDYLYQQQHEEMRRMKAAHQQRLAAAQFMAGVSQLPYDKSMDFILHPQHDPQRAATLMLDEECYGYSPGRLDRDDILGVGLADRSNSASKQIYLTFPADSTFKDEDVSNYFSIFGPVQDVRIPYQQKRMFGFVTFLHPETVKLILARGNPHFICDSRVLVKPYKEKGKVLDKKQQHLQQQQIERGHFSPCSSPSEIDSREQYDFHLGAKVFYNSQEMLLRRKLEEQADLQQAIELQRRRFLNLQLPDLKNECIHNHQRSLSVGSPVYFPSHVNQNIPPYENINKEIIEVKSDSPAATILPPIAATAEQQLQPGVNATCVDDNGCGSGKEGSSNSEKCDLHERSEESSVEHVLPDNLFASPKKFVDDQHNDFSTLVEVNEGTAKSATSSSSENNPACPLLLIN